MQGEMFTTDAYDVTANYHGGAETSRAANEKVARHKGGMRLKILDFLRETGDRGATCEEVELALGMRHQSAGARISELKRDGLVRQAGTRKTSSGCQAVVHVYADAAE